MNKKKPVKTTWPVVLSNFTQDPAHQTFSRCKLKVLYDGESVDHRYFSKAMQKTIAAELPYTPIVSKYDADSDDFVGHADQQSIYGIVDPCVEPSYMEENGYEYLVCDAVLYTERPDDVGKIAAKIEGHAQSLELDPDSFEYVIHYDERKHFKNLEITNGKLIGLSVLGEDQEPAFTGAGFFEKAKAAETMQLLKQYCFAAGKVKEGGKPAMTLNEFITLTWGETAEKVIRTLGTEYSNDGYVSFVDMDSKYVYAWMYYYVSGEKKLLRWDYTADQDGNISFGNVCEVHIVYEPVEPVSTQAAAVTDEDKTKCANEEDKTTCVTEEVTDEQGKSECATEDEDKSKCAATEDEKSKCAEDEDKSKCADNAEDDKSNCVTDEDKSKCAEDDKSDCAEEKDKSECATDKEETQCAVSTTISTSASDQTNGEYFASDNLEGTITNEQQTLSTPNTNSTAFSENERKEFEKLKREEKERLIASYSSILSEEEITNFTAEIDTKSAQDLELELLRLYHERTINEREDTVDTYLGRAFSTARQNKIETSDCLGEYLRKNIRK